VVVTLAALIVELEKAIAEVHAAAPVVDILRMAVAFDDADAGIAAAEIAAAGIEAAGRQRVVATAGGIQVIASVPAVVEMAGHIGEMS
jgi:hypothetical protein